MSTVSALLLGLGVFLVYDSCTAPRARDRATAVPGMGRLRAALGRAGLADLAPSRFLLAVAGSGLGCGLVALVLLGSVAIALVALVSGAWVPFALLAARGRRRRRELRACWPDAVELLAGAVRTGETLVGAVALVADRGPEPLRPAFRSVVADHRVSGDLGGALERMAAAVVDPTADRVVATLLIAQRVGGRELGRVLRTLGAFLREDLATRREVEARQSWTVVAARVAAASPWIVLCFVATRPDAIDAYDSVAGMVVLGVGAVATVVGYRLMIALGRLPEEPRVLAWDAAGG